MRQLTQKIFDRGAFRHRKVGKTRLTQRYGDRAAPSNFNRIGKGFRQITEQLSHLFWRPQVLLIRIEFRPTRVVESATVADAHPGFMGLKLVRADKTHIISSHNRAYHLCGQVYRSMQIIFFSETARTMQLNIKSIREGRHPPLQRGSSLCVMTINEQLAKFSLTATGQRQYTFGMGIQPIPFYAGRSVILPLTPCPRNQQSQVLVALLIHGQQR